MGIKFSNEEVFVENSYYARHLIKKRIISQKLLEYKCVGCGNNGNHNGKSLSLQLDHINGKAEDNRLENLRFLCPNCHSQTDTYAGKASTGKRVRPKICKPKYHEEKKKQDKELWEKLKNDKSIKFGEWGWKCRLAKLIPLSSQKITPWLRRIDPDFLKNIEN